VISPPWPPRHSATRVDGASGSFVFDTVFYPTRVIGDKQNVAGKSHTQSRLLLFITVY